MLLKCLPFLILLLKCCCCYKILVVFPFPGHSHNILGEGYVKHLLDAGHEVTYVTPFPKKNPQKNLRYIDVSENKKFFDLSILDITLIMENKVDLLDHVLFIEIMTNLWKGTAQMEPMQRLMNDVNEKFDLIIPEWLYCELVSGLSAVFDAPFIWSSSLDPHTFILNLVHENLNPAYTVHHTSKDYSFGFLDRVYQLWSVSRIWYHKWATENDEIEDFNNLFAPILAKKGRRLPHYNDVRYNASLVLGNSHIIAGDGIPLPQNYKHIGGYHINNNSEPLPENLKEIFDNAKHGVIYFSLGSNLKCKHLPNSIKNGLLKVFSELKETVIWKFESSIPDLPKNVHIVTWAPQQSILAHPKCKLFITHGGLLSLLETLHHGKPIIGVPFFADQYLNINRAVVKGFAKRVDFNENFAQSLRVAIKEMLENPSYQQCAKELSDIFHDRLVPPGKELVHWVEHVVRTKGAPHLRSAALHVSWYKKMYLDLLLVVAIALVTLYKLLRILFTNIVQIRIHPKEKNC